MDPVQCRHVQEARTLLTIYVRCALQVESLAIRTFDAASIAGDAAAFSFDLDQVGEETERSVHQGASRSADAPELAD